MNYLERNELIMAKVAQQLAMKSFERGREVGTRGTTMKFTSIGSFHSSLLGRDLSVGLKERMDKDTVDYRVESQLARIAVIAKHLPELEPALPIFHGLMLDSEGRATAIITEDFSQGGIYQVVNSGPLDPLPFKLAEIDPSLKEHSWWELERMCFDVNGQLRIGDLDALLFGLNMKQVFTRFPIDITFDDFVDYTRRNVIHCGYLL